VTHYTKDYSNLSDEEKRTEALADIREYLGSAQFNKITRSMRSQPKPTPHLWRFIASFAGVQGYPAEVWYEHIWPS
jgi:hypothetical protein